MNKEEDKWMAYVEWANELLASVGIDLEYYVEENPLIPMRYDSRVYILAKKLVEDIADFVVPEWFCADCDYLRRCNP